MEDDTLKDKEQEELRALLDNPDEDAFSDADNQNSDNSQDEDKTSAEDENEDGDDTASENDEDSSEDNSDSDENKDKAKNETKPSNEDQDKETKDRWHGKSREEVIKAYESLETRITALENKTGSENKTDQDKNPSDKEAKSGETEDNNDENNQLGIPSADELQKMTPTDFAKWVLGRIDEGVKRTIETQEKIRDAVHQEITDAKKEHPLQDPDYRKMVLAIIDAASAKGTTIPLKEACSQVDAFLGKHKGQSEDLSNEEKSRLKKAKAQVESGAGAPTQPDGSDAETKRIQKALAGSGSKSPLGGLGI